MQDKIINTLLNYRKSPSGRDKYGIFIDNIPVYLSTKDVYGTPGSAKRVVINKILNEVGHTYTQMREKEAEVKEALNKLIEDKVIEIRLL